MTAQCLHARVSRYPDGWRCNTCSLRFSPVVLVEQPAQPSPLPDDALSLVARLDELHAKAAGAQLHDDHEVVHRINVAKASLSPVERDVLGALFVAWPRISEILRARVSK